jgi:hypothetical protein
VTTGAIAIAVHNVIRDHWLADHDVGSWESQNARYQADLTELVRFKLENPEAPLSSYHANWVALGQTEVLFEDLTLEQAEEDVKSTALIIALLPQWEGNVAYG